MKARSHADFWAHFDRLPANIQKQARRKYLLWGENPRHRSLQFKKVRDDLWSARVTDDYRAMAYQDEDGWVWFWIGTHRDYEKLLK